MTEEEIKDKEDIFDKNPDIAAELALWISKNRYKDEDAVTVEGYTAGRIAEMQPVLRGEGSFLYLALMREDPDGIKKNWRSL